MPEASCIRRAANHGERPRPAPSQPVHAPGMVHHDAGQALRAALQKAPGEGEFKRVGWRVGPGGPARTWQDLAGHARGLTAANMHGSPWLAGPFAQRGRASAEGGWRAHRKYGRPMYARRDIPMHSRRRASILPQCHACALELPWQRALDRPGPGARARRVVLGRPRGYGCYPLVWGGAHPSSP